MDNELLELCDKSNNNEIDELEDWKFLASCLKIGLSISDLKELKYKDVAKIAITINREQNKENFRKAGQDDINKLLSL